MRLTFPPVDFPLYGLGADLRLPGRRLWNVEGEQGAPTWGLWLWHGRAPQPTHGEPWVIVGCLPRERHATVMTPQGGDPVREVAFAATFALINATMPSEREQPDRYLETVLDFADRQADAYERWANVTWRCDGREVPARLFGWAGAWAGFTTAAAGVDLVAVGHTVDGRDVSLVELADTSAFHFDHRSTIHVAEDTDRGWQANLLEGGDHDPPEGWPLHPDHEDVITAS